MAKNVGFWRDQLCPKGKENYSNYTTTTSGVRYEKFHPARVLSIEVNAHFVEQENSLFGCEIKI
jgi:hypothetical protein